MSEIRVASRYAKSLADLAMEKGLMEKVYADMALFSKVVKENPSFASLLKNPIVTHLKKQVIIKKVFAGKVSDLSLSFFDLITKKNRENMLAGIAEAFQQQYYTFKGIQKATVTTTFALNDDLRKSFKNKVKEITGATEAELEERIDKSIIGGFILKIGDRQIDDSLQSKLKDLELSFSDKTYVKAF